MLEDHRSYSLADRQYLGRCRYLSYIRTERKKSYTPPITVPASEKGLLAIHLFILTQLNFPNDLVVNLLYKV